jgi:hypothetical protein
MQNRRSDPAHLSARYPALLVEIAYGAITRFSHTKVLRNHMVDSLKQALEQLEAPICPNCNMEMRWSRSTLVEPSPVTITHLFVCLGCNRVAETTSKVRSATIVPPDKLSAPRRAA